MDDLPFLCTNLPTAQGSSPNGHVPRQHCQYNLVDRRTCTASQLELFLPQYGVRVRNRHTVSPSWHRTDGKKTLCVSKQAPVISVMSSKTPPRPRARNEPKIFSSSGTHSLSLDGLSLSGNQFRSLQVFRSHWKMSKGTLNHNQNRLPTGCSGSFTPSEWIIFHHNDSVYSGLGPMCRPRVPPFLFLLVLSESLQEEVI